MQTIYVNTKVIDLLSQTSMPGILLILTAK